MQILKSKKDRIPDNHLVDTRPDVQVFDLDKKARERQAAKSMSTNFVDDEGKTASQRLDESYTERVANFVKKFAPPFGRPDYAYLTVIENNVIKWDVEALNIFIRSSTSWFNPFDQLVRYVKNNLLDYYKVDRSMLDCTAYSAEVDYHANLFKEDYLKQLNGDD
jgi:hypothetical protein